MVVSYSSLNRFETPKLILCNPGSLYNNGVFTKVIGILTDVSDMEIVFNYNSTSELNFRVNKVDREDIEINTHTSMLYKAIQNRRLLFVDNIGYFMITNIDDGYDDNLQYKDVKAQSIDVEIQQKMVPYIPDGTYRFSTDITTNTKGLLETIVETLPLWTIDHVDNAIASRFRTFEDVDTSLNCLGFMLDNMQDAYECIFLFDPVHRKISVYDQANYVRRTDIHITKDDIINSLNITENADDLYTAISVIGDENVTISAINPIGASVIYNFDYYLDWMTPELKSKVIEWQSAVEDAKTPYYNLNLLYYNKLSTADGYQFEIDKLKTQLTMYKRCRDNIIAESNTTLVNDYNTVIINNGGKPIEIYEEITDTLKSIDSLTEECQQQYNSTVKSLEDVNATIVPLETQIKAFHEELSLITYFTEDELLELNHYIFEGSYTDEYVKITDIMSYEEKFDQMKLLYDRAQARLQRVSQPTQEFNIDAENFIFIKEFEHWGEQLETGCLINVELNMDDIAQLFLSNITINYEDHSLNMTFGNRFNKFDPKSLFDDVLGGISKTANSLSYLKEILYPIKSGEFDDIKEAIQTSRNLTMGAAIVSDNEEVIIDASGYTGRKKLIDGTYDPRQIKITGRNIVFTDNAWDECKVAIGEIVLGNNKTVYGVNCDVLVGNIIAGTDLTISGGSNINGMYAVTINQNGLVIMNNTNNPALQIKNAKGETVFTADSDGNLEIVGTITSDSGKIGNWNIGKLSDSLGVFHSNIYNTIESDNGKQYIVGMQSSDKDTHFAFYVKEYVKEGEYTTETNKFFVRNNGQLYAENADIKGKITATTGTIGNWNIQSGYLYSVYDNIGTIIKPTGDVCFAAGVSNWTLGDPTSGANFQIWHNGKFRVGGDGLGTSDTNYSFIVNPVEDGKVENIIINAPTTVRNNMTATSNGGFFLSNGNNTCGLFIDSSGYRTLQIITYSGEQYVILKNGNINASGDITINGRFASIGNVRPYTSSTGSQTQPTLGTSSYKWEEVYARNGTIQTSDKNFKNNIAELSDVYKQLFMKLIPVSFTFTDGTSGRTHIGFISQDVEIAMSELGMTGLDFAGFCKDIKTITKTDENGEEIEIPDLDENGNKQYLYSLRYDEFIGIIAKVLQDTVNQVTLIKERLNTQNI